MNYVVQGMLFGDEGKGSIVAHLCREHDVDCVVRWCGGSQASHAVVLPDGRSHRFSQWGSGTLEGVPTYLGSDVVIYPEAMHNEAEHLKSLGVDPWPLLSVDPNCLVTTEIARLVNRALEVSRGEACHGSCGHGIGETRRLNEEYGVGLVAADLAFPTLTREVISQQMEVYHKSCGWKFEEVDVSAMCSHSEKWQHAWGVFADTLVYEGSQGALLDVKSGFFPHVTRGDVTPTDEIRANAEVIGVVRSYLTRHGAGPLSTERTGGLITVFGKDPHNTYNPWQGELRYGIFDFGLLDRALKYCPVDCFAVNHMDEYPGSAMMASGEIRAISGEGFLAEIAKRAPVKYLGYSPCEKLSCHPCVRFG